MLFAVLPPLLIAFCKSPIPDHKHADEEKARDAKADACNGAH